MKSTIVQNLHPEFNPVAIVWSNTLPEDTFQYKKGRFGCILYLFAEASRRGKITGCSRESISCSGGKTALGLDKKILSNEQLNRNAAFLSKGFRSTSDKEAYQALMEKSPKGWKDLYEFGERRHCNAELAKEWILYGVPRYDISYKYVLFKPLDKTNQNENIKAVVFPVTPLEFGGLFTLVGSVMHGTDPVQVPQGPECNSITAFAYAQADSDNSRAVLGMLGVEGREVMRKRFRAEVMALTLPAPLFYRLEQEANDCIFQTPSWKKLAKNH